MKPQMPFVIAALVIVFSCNTNHEKSYPSFAPQVVEANGYVVPKDSMAKPKTVPVGKTRIVPAGKPKVTAMQTNVRTARVPITVTAGSPKVCIPGQNGILLPKTVPAIPQPVTAGIPEILIAKDAQIKGQHSQNFSSFGILQGLKSATVMCLLEDRNGNLWIGNWGGGVSKYDGKNFTHFTEKEGLNYNFVCSILEDKQGNLWFGSAGAGVSKYDGKRFTHFTEKGGLLNNWVWNMAEDKQGNIWLGTLGGLSKYDGKSFTHFTENEGLTGNRISSIVADKSNCLWIGTDRGVNRYDGKTFNQLTEKQGLINNSVESILEDRMGNIWIGTYGGGVDKYDGKTFTHLTEKDGLGTNNVECILEDRSGNLWIGGWDGALSKYDGKTYTYFAEREGLSDNYVHCLIQDKRGNLWIGTDRGGVSRYGGKSFTHFTKQEGLSANSVISIVEDRTGHLWFGTWTGGVNRFDGKSFTHFNEKEGQYKFVVQELLEDKKGNLWLGDWNGLSKYDGKSFTYFTQKEDLGNSPILCILEDKSGSLWFGTHSKGVVQYDGNSYTQFTTKEGLSNNIITCLLEDKRGNLWFGTYGGGINKYDGRNFTHFTTKEGLKDDIIRTMMEDQDGNIWIGTWDSGVSVYNGKSFIHLTQTEGLSNNDVRSIIQDKSGDLWFGTAFGLSKLEKEKLTFLTKAITDRDAYSLNHSLPLFKTYTYEDGFSGIDVNWEKGIHETNDGTIWIGAGDRLTAFHPAEETLDTIAPNIQLTNVTLHNENIPWQEIISTPDTAVVLSNGVIVNDVRFDTISKWYCIPQNLSLAYNNNYLAFQFVGITIHSPRKVKYQYKLEGLEKNWSALTSRSEATYGNLPHGNYTFKVKAVNGDGYWSKELNYSFIIRPPWWHTWWAYTLFALLSVGLIYALFRHRLAQVRMQHEILVQQHKASELEMQALRAQMNPHFIFNSLNSINMFILEKDKLQASEYLSKFSRLIRLILQNSQEAFIPLEKELEALQLYLELESLRFEHKFDYAIAVDDEVDTAAFKLPPLIIQPYVENAIWHGLMHKKEQGHLEIRVYQEGQILCCKITDDGIGRTKAAGLKSKSSLSNKSMGMRITADRIQMLKQQYLKNSSITVNDLVLPDGHPAGTEVLIQIPVYND